MMIMMIMMMMMMMMIFTCFVDVPCSRFRGKVRPRSWSWSGSARSFRRRRTRTTRRTGGSSEVLGSWISGHTFGAVTWQKEKIHEIFADGFQWFSQRTKPRPSGSMDIFRVFSSQPRLITGGYLRWIESKVLDLLMNWGSNHGGLECYGY